MKISFKEFLGEAKREDVDPYAREIGSLLVMDVGVITDYIKKHKIKGINLMQAIGSKQIRTSEAIGIILDDIYPALIKKIVDNAFKKRK